MADKAEKTEAVSPNGVAPDQGQASCRQCSDTGVVTLRFLGDHGEFPRQVPCPECQEGIRVSGRVPQIEAMDQQVTLLTAGVVLLAIAFGLLAWTFRKELSALAVSAMEEVPEVQP